jgi:hypothetical protein
MPPGQSAGRGPVPADPRGGRRGGRSGRRLMRRPWRRVSGGRRCGAGAGVGRAQGPGRGAAGCMGASQLLVLAHVLDRRCWRKSCSYIQAHAGPAACMWCAGLRSAGHAAARPLHGPRRAAAQSAAPRSHGGVRLGRLGHCAERLLLRSGAWGRVEEVADCGSATRPLTAACRRLCGAVALLKRKRRDPSTAVPMADGGAAARRARRCLGGARMSNASMGGFRELPRPDGWRGVGRPQRQLPPGGLRCDAASAEGSGGAPGACALQRRPTASDAVAQGRRPCPHAVQQARRAPAAFVLRRGWSRAH